MVFEIYFENQGFYSNRKEAIDLASSSSFGELKEGKIQYNIYEVLYLLEKKKVVLVDSKNKQVSMNKISKRVNKSFYSVFKDLRNKGHILKEGLKFGADFRVYEKGSKPGKQHAKYLLYISKNKEKLDMKEFCAKARVAHSTNKVLLFAVVDSEQDISYYEVNWKSKN